MMRCFYAIWASRVFLIRRTHSPARFLVRIHPPWFVENAHVASCKPGRTHQTGAKTLRQSDHDAGCGTIRACATRPLRRDPPRYSMILRNHPSYCIRCRNCQIWPTAMADTAIPVLTLGVGDPRKNTATTVSAVQALREDPAYADVHLIMIGQLHPSGSFQTRTAPDLRHGGSHLPGFRCGLHDLYARIRAPLPSWYDGFGLPLHEAATAWNALHRLFRRIAPRNRAGRKIFLHRQNPNFGPTLRRVFEAPELHRTTPRPNADTPDIGAIVRWVDEQQSRIVMKS